MKAEATVMSECVTGVSTSSICPSEAMGTRPIRHILCDKAEGHCLCAVGYFPLGLVIFQDSPA